jgi:hypothetical protein
MKQKVLPTTVTLKEDDDQGESDIAFFATSIAYSIFVFVSPFIFTGEDYVGLGKFCLVMTNMFAFFPILQAQGLWLKLLLLTNALSSMMWHWIEVGQHLPGESDMYGHLDRCFSVMTIASYSMQWLPIPVRKVDPNTFWKRNFMGKPRETAEWRCRFTISLFVNMVVSIGAGYMVYKDDSTASFAGIGTIAVALCLSVYHLCIGEMSVGKKYRLKFAFWTVVGSIVGITAFVYKTKETYMTHSLWHTYVFSSAYCFSRASEYLQVRND